MTLLPDQTTCGKSVFTTMENCEVIVSKITKRMTDVFVKANTGAAAWVEATLQASRAIGAMTCPVTM